MTATKIVMADNDTVVLETFDFRSEFSFDDFLSWLGEQLRLSVSLPSGGEETGPVTFAWDGSTFDAAWDEAHGCFVRVAAQERSDLERMQAVLAS